MTPEAFKALHGREPTDEHDLLDDTDPEAVVDDQPRTAPISVASPEQAARLLMVQVDPLFRSLPYEQRTATLLNLLVTYAAEHPAAQEKRGKFINALTEEFKKRLQQYLPLIV